MHLVVGAKLDVCKFLLDIVERVERPRRKLVRGARRKTGSTLRMVASVFHPFALSLRKLIMKVFVRLCQTSIGLLALVFNGIARGVVPLPALSHGMHVLDMLRRSKMLVL